MSWINDLDALASAGVINFDAPAYIKGTQPRYYGNPAFETIVPELPQAKTQPVKDEFKKSENPVQNPKWKKVLFGVLLTAGTIFAASKLKPVKNLLKKVDMTKLKELPKNIWQRVKNGWSRLVNFIKPKKP